MSTGSLAARTLDARQLSVTYGSFTAVDGVSLYAEQGEVLGLLGPNGAGKTSVIRALTTIVPVSHGTATVAGHQLSDPAAVRASIGVLPESNGYPPAQTGASYLRFHGQLFGLSRAEAGHRAERLLGQFGLAGENKPIGTFSRGMRQRLGLARALVNDPEVLFLDEPTLGLDPAGKEEILRHLTRVAVDKGTTVVLCSHLLDEVERVCDRVAIMNRGHVVAEGTVPDVVAASGVAARGTIRVAPADLPAAQTALLGSAAADSLAFDNTRPGDLAFRLTHARGARAEVLRLLLDSGLEPRAFDFEGGHLSEAFLALTGATSGAQP